MHNLMSAAYLHDEIGSPAEALRRYGASSALLAEYTLARQALPRSRSSPMSTTRGRMANYKSDRVSAQHLLVQVGELTGHEFALDGVSREGTQGGGVFVRWPNGRPGVVTYADPPIQRMRLTADVLDLAKAKGCPVPAQELVVELPDGRIVVVHERLPGEPIRQVDVPLVDALVAVNDGFAGVLADRPDVPGPRLGLRQSGPDHPRHEALAGYDNRTRTMLARIRAIGDTVPDELPGDDLVHPDFARGNVLVGRNGEITGVIDWSSAALRGNRAFALVSLRSDLEWRAFYDSSEWVPQAAVDRLDHILRTSIEPTVLNACWAHWTLHKACAAIRADGAKELDMWLTLGDSWLP